MHKILQQFAIKCYEVAIYEGPLNIFDSFSIPKLWEGSTLYILNVIRIDSVNWTADTWITWNIMETEKKHKIWWMCVWIIMNANFIVCYIFMYTAIQTCRIIESDSQRD